MRSDRCGSDLIDCGDAPSWYGAVADQADVADQVDVGRVMSDRGLKDGHNESCHSKAIG